MSNTFKALSQDQLLTISGGRHSNAYKNMYNLGNHIGKISGKILQIAVPIILA